MTTSPTNNFDLLQNYIPYKIVKYKDNKFYVMISIFANDANIFGFNIYIPINEKLCKEYEGNEIWEFLINIAVNSDDAYDIIMNGNSEFIINEDYFILSQNINDYKDISSIKIKDIDSISYFIYKNKEYTNYYTDDELNSLNMTFMKIIQENSDKYNDTTDALEYLHKAVIDFYANGQYDYATILMNTVFNTQINTITTSNCGCNSQSDCVSGSSTTTALNTGTDLISIDDATCLDKYKAAMFQWLIAMLSDVNFYCNWMFTDLTGEDDISIPNDILLDKLINLLTEFLDKGYDLSNLKGCTKACGCGHTNKYSNNDCGDLLNTGIGVNTDNCSNASIISNYIKVLNWVKNNEINENKNKIYVYGKQFAEIFPLLNF